MEADCILANQIVNATGDKVLADIVYTGVRVGGGEGWDKPYSWGFGRTK